MATALIAEDEPLLAMALRAELKALWPELEILAEVGDGQSALESTLSLKPQILFLDIRMPEMSGIEVAMELVDAWDHSRPLPAIVFATAYDEYALQAFEARAIDYLVKPLQRERLQKTVSRLKEKLATEAGTPDGAGSDIENTLSQLRALLNAGMPESARGPAGPAPEKLSMIQAGVGMQIRMIPIDEVCYFEAADKYVRVITHDGKDWLIRKPLKELLEALDSKTFWQIHRGVIVRASAIERVTRDESGKLSLRMRGQKTDLAVSRLYGHLFKAM